MQTCYTDFDKRKSTQLTHKNKTENMKVHFSFSFIVPFKCYVRCVRGYVIYVLKITTNNEGHIGNVRRETMQ